MELFDWDQFDEPDNIDLSDILASVPPFELPANPLLPQHASSSHVRGLGNGEYGNTQSHDSTRQHNVRVGGSYGPTCSQVRPLPGYPSVTYWIFSASQSIAASYSRNPPQLHKWSRPSSLRDHIWQGKCLEWICDASQTQQRQRGPIVPRFCQDSADLVAEQCFKPVPLRIGKAGTEAKDRVKKGANI